MPAAIAAAATQSKTFDFVGKSFAPSSDVPSFASNLHDARQKLPSKSAGKFDEDDAIDVEATKPATVDRAETPAEPEAASDQDAEPVAEPTDAEAKEDRDENSPDPSAAALAMAAMMATPGEDGVTPQAANGTSADAAAPTIAAAALAATAELPDDATIGQSLAGAPTDANSTKPVVAKPANEKVDALAAEMTPVDGAEQIVPAIDANTSGSSDGGGDAQRDADAELGAVADAATKPAADERAKTFDDLLNKLMPDVGPQASATDTKSAATKIDPPVRPEQQFARDNVDRVVTTVRSQVNASGNGSMRMRLDPPELGALDVAVKMLDGKMTASFMTSNDQATQLLSHSLNQLKSSLETAGINVDRIEVRQAAPAANASDARGDQQQSSDRGFGSSHQQQGEQQRKQMVDRLWRKYAYGTDEVDLVA